MQNSADTVTKDLLVEPAKRGRKPLAAAVPVVVDADLAPVAQAVAVLDERASRVRAVALQMGYQLPGDGVDADLIQRDIAANMRRSVEAWPYSKKPASTGSLASGWRCLALKIAWHGASCLPPRNSQIGRWRPF